MHTNHQKLLSSRYTGSPNLGSNLLIASLQLFVWYFLHPTAWRHYVKCIATSLPPDFNLTECNWRQPPARRLLVTGYIIWPLLVSMIVLIVLAIIKMPFQQIIIGLACGFLAHITVAIALGLIGSYVLGVTSGMAFGIASGLIAAICSTPEAVYSFAQGATGIVAALGSSHPGIYMGTAISVGCGIAVSISGQASQFSLPRQIGGLVVGVIIGGLMISALTIAAGKLAPLFFETRPDIGKRISLGLTVGGVICLALIIAGGWQMKRWSRSFVAPALASIIFGVLNGIANGAFAGLAGGIGFEKWRALPFGFSAGLGLATWAAGLFVLPAIIARFLGGRWAGAVAGALSSGIGWAAFYVVRFEKTTWWPIVPASLILVLLGLTINVWRPWLFYLFESAWNTILYNLDEKRRHQPLSLLHQHAAFWDEFQYLRLGSLDEHLVLVMERNAAEGKKATDYLINNNQQIWAVNEAQIEFDVHKLERCRNIIELSSAHHDIFVEGATGPASELLKEFKQISADIAAALDQHGDINKRGALVDVEDRLKTLSLSLGRRRERHARRFRPIAVAWLGLVTNHMETLYRDAKERLEIASPYQILNPLSIKHRLFVGREDTAQQIEELLRSPNSPPMLLYGQRRMGKTSLLLNLGRLLPSHILPLFLNMQGRAAAAQTDAGFLHKIITDVSEAAKRLRGFDFPEMSLETLQEDPYLRFNEWIDQVGTTVTRLVFLLALDEMEALNHAFDQGWLNEAALLGMLRDQMQHNARLKILMACSHTLDEMPRWYTYLVNVRVVKISYLREEEARHLIESPLPDFVLRYEPQATKRVLELTRCHPALVQLLCQTIIAIKNKQPRAQRRWATIEDVESAVPAALPYWEIPFRDMREGLPAQAIKLLRFMAKFGEHTIVAQEKLLREFPRDFEEARKHLLRRDLIENTGAGYRIQVELFRRWFADDAHFE